MSWEEEVLALFEDLEQRAEGLALAARDAEVAELARAEYAEVTLESRLHSSVGRLLEVDVLAVGSLRGRLARVGSGWCLLAVEPAGAADGSTGWVLRVPAVLSVRGLAAGAVPEAVRGVTARLGLGSVLRGIAEGQGRAVVVLLDGGHRRGRLLRVGADFLELADDRDVVRAVPFEAIAGLRPV